MHKLTRQLGRHMTDLAWSLWAELGVASVLERHQHCTIDPEALLAFTNEIGALDPRLSELANVWSLLCHQYIAVARLRAISKKLDASQPVDIDALRIQPPERFARSKLKRVNLQFDRPSTLILRCRALFGVSARADIMVHLIFLPRGQRTTATLLAKSISMTKLNVAHVLKTLRDSGICGLERDGNRDMFYLIRRKELCSLVQPHPKYLPPWNDIFKFLLTCWRLTTAASNQPTRVAAVEAFSSLSPWLAKWRATSLPAPSPTGNLEADWRAIGAWCCKVFAQLADGSSPWLAMR